jgi:hypothetical protein
MNKLIIALVAGILVQPVSAYAQQTLEQKRSLYNNNNSRPLLEDRYDAAERREAERYNRKMNAPMPSINGYNNPSRLDPYSRYDKRTIEERNTWGQYP